MTEFKPSISERNTDKLIEIVNSIGKWKPEAISQAKSELIKRKISSEKQNETISDWKKTTDELIELDLLELENNKIESYKIWEMIYLFLLFPYFILRTSFLVENSLWHLRRNNYNLKFKQLIIIKLLSIIFYSTSIYVFVKWKEEKWKDEIEKADIREWEKRNGFEKK